MEGIPADVEALEVEDSCESCLQEPSVVTFSFSIAGFLHMKTEDDNSLPISALDSCWDNQMESFKESRTPLSTLMCLIGFHIHRGSYCRSLFYSPSV